MDYADYAAQIDAAFAHGKRPTPPTLARLMRDAYLKNPTKTLVVGLDESRSCSDAYRRARDMAGYFYRVVGLEPGDTALIALPNLIAFPSLLAAMQMCGVRLAMLPPEVGAEAFSRCVSLVHPKLFIMSSKEQCDLAKATDPDATVVSLGSNCEGYVHLERAGKSSRGLDMTDSHEGEDRDIQLVLFSSGSTGAPKAIVNRLSSFVLNGFALTKNYRLAPQDVLYVPVPFAHVFGIVGMCAALVSGATLVTSAKYAPEQALQLITSTHATVHLGVPTMFLRELRENQKGDWDLSSLRVGLVAGAGCPGAAIKEFDERWGCKIAPSYGMTETAATLTVLSPDAPLDARERGTGFPVQGAAMKLAEGTGEILCKSPSFMEGIMGDDGSLDLCLDEEGWFHTGDVGSYDDVAGYSVVGRIKDLIIRGGVNIFPVEVEKLYDGHPGVSECYLVGYPDPELGERTCLCVIAGVDKSATAVELRNFAIGRVEKCRIPDVVLKMSDFPRLNNGKIDKKKLRERVRSLLGQYSPEA